MLLMLPPGARMLQQGSRDHRSTNHSSPVALAPADDLPHLEQHLVLHHDEHRRDLVGEHVGVSGGGQPLASHAHNVQTLVINAMLNCTRKY